MGNNIKKFKSAFARGVGRSHISTDTPCQDYVCTQRDTQKGIISLSLSDGAGSCSLSHIGSRIIVKTTNSFMIKNFDKLFNENKEDALKQNLIDEIKKNLYIRAVKDSQDSLKPYSGTLLSVATNGSKYIALHLGDGVIGNIQNGETKVLSKPSNGEYSNTTFFVTDKDALQNLQLYSGEINNISSFIVMSDGTQDSLYDKKNDDIATAYIRLSEWLNKHSEKKLSKILKENIEKVFTQKSTDDCSIGIININIENGE